MIHLFAPHDSLAALIKLSVELPAAPCRSDARIAVRPPLCKQTKLIFNSTGHPLFHIVYLLFFFCLFNSSVFECLSVSTEVKEEETADTQRGQKSPTQKDFRYRKESGKQRRILQDKKPGP